MSVRFNCPKLRKAFEETRETFEGHQDFMNMVSADIKQLESFLSENAPHKEVEMEIGEAEYLYWNGSRILYEYQDSQRKPLIENKIATRIRVHPFLSQFLLKIKGEIL